MTDGDTHYAIDGDAMRQAIEWWLDPVINRLQNMHDKYFPVARDAVYDGVMGHSPGWQGGDGHGFVKGASFEFLSDVFGAADSLCEDQGQAASSLKDYRTMLLKHVAWAERTDQEHAEHFHSIRRGMDEVR